MDTLMEVPIAPNTFEAFPKIPRLSRDCVITEKIDGTNAQIYITKNEHGELEVRAGSRNRWLSKEADNYHFYAWVEQHFTELLKLGEGRHFGEWWGLGINSGYGLFERRFSLFNVKRWADNPERPSCCGVVPVLYQGPFNDLAVAETMARLKEGGSVAAPGFMEPEGIVIYHQASQQMFKKTLVGDAKPKGMTSGAAG